MRSSTPHNNNVSGGQTWATPQQPNSNIPGNESWSTQQNTDGESWSNQQQQNTSGETWSNPPPHQYDPDSVIQGLLERETSVVGPICGQCETDGAKVVSYNIFNLPPVWDYKTQTVCDGF